MKVLGIYKGMRAMLLVVARGRLVVGQKGRVIARVRYANMGCVYR